MAEQKVLCNNVNCIHWILGSTCTNDVVNIAVDTDACRCCGFEMRTPEYLLEHSCQNPNFPRRVLEILCHGPYQPKVRCNALHCMYLDDNNYCCALVLRISGENAKTIFDTNCCSCKPLVNLNMSSLRAGMPAV